MKKQITIICDMDTTVPHLLNDKDFEIIATSKDDVWTMIKKEVPEEYLQGDGRE
jgi:hypothetical protein